MARQMYGSCQVSSPLSFFRSHRALRFVHLARVFLGRLTRLSHFCLVRVQTRPRAVHYVMSAFPVPRMSDERDLCSDAHFYSAYTAGDMSAINFAFNTRLTTEIRPCLFFLSFNQKKNLNLSALFRHRRG